MGPAPLGAFDGQTRCFCTAVLTEMNFSGSGDSPGPVALGHQQSEVTNVPETT